jgi:hypothetical protein
MIENKIKYSLTICRQQDPFLLRNIHIKINSKTHLIRPFDTLTLDLNPGVYKIKAVLDFFYSSEVILVEINDDKPNVNLYLNYFKSKLNFLDLILIAFKFKRCFLLSYDPEPIVSHQEKSGMPELIMTMLLLPSLMCIIFLLLDWFYPSMLNLPVLEKVFLFLYPVIYFLRFKFYFEKHTNSSLKYYNLMTALIFIMFAFLYKQIFILNLILGFFFVFIFSIEIYFKKMFNVS